MKGRKPTPAALKVLAGNPGRRPIPNEPESAPLPSDDQPPEWLHDYAKDFYRDILDVVTGMGVATEADRLGIITLAQSLAEVKIANENMNKFGRVIKNSKGGAERNPYAVHAVQFIAFVRQFITEYGMTPCSRAKLTAKATDESNPLADFLNRKKSSTSG